MYSDFEYEDDSEYQEPDEDTASTIHRDDMYQCRASQIGWW
jgi:hypothetical protein